MAAIVEQGVAALRQGQYAEARRLFEQAIAAGGRGQAPWFLLAQACLQLGDHPAAEGALDRTLAEQPRHLWALIMKGDCRARADDARAAVSFYTAALNAAPAAGEIPPMLAAELERAKGFTESADGGFSRQLERHLGAAGIDPAAQSARFQAALDILAGKKQIYLQQPNSFYFPGLPQIQFYEREAFPWLARVEAAVPAMRAELEAVIAGGDGFEPYVKRDLTRPQPANHLLEDPSWSACYLLSSGEPTEHAARCPQTMMALGEAPMPRIAGRSPMALFSLLRPGTHIKPHNGLLNTRLICHVPLIVPPGCRLRVGHEVREWEEGKALIFDDSIEHEAWNEGGGTRVVLLFEIWRPEISVDERRALTAMFEAITLYSGSSQDG
jgi:aspartyl/asparaginyl beta-hydroxylase (cupin superfamily)